MDMTIGGPGDAESPSIYIVFRVFGLGGERIGLKLYVDPEALRRKRALDFNADKYEVTPGRRA